MQHAGSFPIRDPFGVASGSCLSVNDALVKGGTHYLEVQMADCFLYQSAPELATPASLRENLMSITNCLRQADDVGSFICACLPEFICLKANKFSPACLQNALISTSDMHLIRHGLTYHVPRLLGFHLSCLIKLVILI